MKNIRLLKVLAMALTISSLGAIDPVNAEEWTKSNGSWYYTDNQGNNKTGWVQDNGYWYYLGSDGIMKTGWIYDSGNWYYCYSNGQMATDTTINGYYVNSTGAWTNSKPSSNSSGTALTPQDVSGNHHVRGDISSSDGDYVAANKLTNYNLNLSEDSDIYLRSLALNIAQGRITIDEARNNCIGKVVDGKYKITDIKFFDQSFINANTGTNVDDKIKAIKNSSLANYYSNSYKYDEYLVFSCGNARAGEWEAMRVVTELEAI